ncbi:hypothetical protein ACFOZY_05225 [Chungangia koreensis]|uniref:Streptomycin adenylyltransferase n=1 Tax=Chungangia koreensis TaxID=752657 RepID=A0ABV8X1M8_9LACT
MVDPHFEDRDAHLRIVREELLKRAVADLTSDEDVLAIYLDGSLSRNEADRFSDIDLHTIVTPEKIADFIMRKMERAEKWGNVLFHENTNPYSPVDVSHFDSFVKVDSWYHTIDEIKPSIWLRNMKILYDPNEVLEQIAEDSSKIVYKSTSEEVEFWRGKVLAFIHETYRAVRRKEYYYALSNLDRVRWLMALGWYMEMDEHLDSSYGVWSKIEGERSKLSPEQLSILKSWESFRHPDRIMDVLRKIVPEFKTLNKSLSEKVVIETREELIDQCIGMVL